MLHCQQHRFDAPLVLGLDEAALGLPDLGEASEAHAREDGLPLRAKDTGECKKQFRA
jgi:hypothetical protein